MSKKCLGCGVPLQESNPSEKGYTNSLEMDYCKRCFRITHYHDLNYQKETVDGKNIINALNQKKGFVFFFLDFLNISKEALSYYEKILLPKCLVVSKSDTIPKSVYFPKIIHWLQNNFKITDSILFVQNNSKSSIKKVLKIMEEQHLNQFYMIGMTNAGKSTFINEFLEYTESKKNLLTVSEKPNTTLDFIKIPFTYGYLFDTAGIPYHYYECDNEFLKKANVEKEIYPLTYPLKNNMSLIIEQNIRIELDTFSSLTLFASDKLKVTKVYDKNTKLKNENKVELFLEANSNILIKGVCFLYIKNACSCIIYGVEENIIEVIPSFMGGNI